MADPIVGVDICLFVAYNLPTVNEEGSQMAEERIVQTDPDYDAGSAAAGAATLISVIVWSIVVLVLLAVALYALHVYLHLF